MDLHLKTFFIDKLAPSNVVDVLEASEDNNPSSGDTLVLNNMVDVVASLDGGGNKDTSAEAQNLFFSQDSNLLSNFSPQKPDPISRIYPHNSFKEAITILEMYGTVINVPGDGSCGVDIMPPCYCYSSWILFQKT
jgi:hypothetical protein